MNATEKDLEQRVNEVFMESFEIPAERLQPNQLLFNDLGLDSLDIVDLIVALQKKFGVKIRNDERIRRIRTLGDLYAFLRTVQEEAACASGASAANNSEARKETPLQP